MGSNAESLDANNTCNNCQAARIMLKKSIACRCLALCPQMQRFINSGLKLLQYARPLLTRPPTTELWKL